jgi:aldose 1-epimerase
MREEIHDPRVGVPSGRLLPVESTRFDFNPRTGVALGSNSLNDTFVHLHQAPLDSGPIVEIRDPQNGYGLRITMLSSYIKAIHVESAPADRSILIEPRFNYDDPFGHEWSPQEDTGIVTLQPGKSVQWRIRFEIFSLTAAPSYQP